jgi:hypothetical protein
MADVLRVKFNPRWGWSKHEAQETGEPSDSPDVERPPDQDLPVSDEERGDIPSSPDAPPFTGEDVEDVGPPRKRDRPLPM